MTLKQKNAIKTIDQTIKKYRGLISELLESGTASASISSPSSSKSYVRLQVKDYRTEINMLMRERGAILRSGRNRRSSPDFDRGF